MPKHSITLSDGTIAHITEEKTLMDSHQRIGGITYTSPDHYGNLIHLLEKSYPLRQRIDVEVTADSLIALYKIGFRDSIQTFLAFTFRKTTVDEIINLISLVASDETSY